MPGITGRQETMDQILALVLLIGSINTAVKGIVAGADQEDINTSVRKSDMFYEMEELVNRILIKKGLTQNLIADMVALKDINSQQKLEIAGLKRELTLLQDRQRSLLKAMENEKHYLNEVMRKQDKQIVSSNEKVEELQTILQNQEQYIQEMNQEIAELNKNNHVSQIIEPRKRDYNLSYEENNESNLDDEPEKRPNIKKEVSVTKKIFTDSSVRAMNLT